MKIAAILLIGGRGERFGHPFPKQFHRIEQRRLYLYTLERIERSALFDEIILVCHPEWIEEVRGEVAGEICLTPGGITRQASSFAGLKACSPSITHVVIHDGVRPCVSQKILRKHVDQLRCYSALNTCIPSADTLVYSQTGESIEAIPPRAHYLRGQTPQSFSFDLIWEAHVTSSKTDASDDCSLVLDLGYPVQIIEGSEENIKITTEFDLCCFQGRYCAIETPS